jgi:hypothetical protein
MQTAVSQHQELIIDDPIFYQTPTQGSDQHHPTSTAQTFQGHGAQ